MELAQLPAFRTDEQGVTFRYLVFQLTSGGQERTLVRGLNYLPYDSQLTQRIVNWTLDELEKAGFDPATGELMVEGGGTLTLNPYYETATLFGENPEYGEESDRGAVEALVKKAYAELEVSSFKSGEELPPPPKPKRPPRKKPKAASSESAAAAEDVEGEPADESEGESAEETEPAS